MEVLIPGDFASDFNDGENLRNSFALSPELISKSQRSQELNFAESDFVLDLRNSGILRQMQPM